MFFYNEIWPCWREALLAWDYLKKYIAFYLYIHILRSILVVITFNYVPMCTAERVEFDREFSLKP